MRSLPTTTQAPFVGGSVICLNTGCGTIGGPATALLFPEMTFLQRKGCTKGIKQEVKGGKQHSADFYGKRVFRPGGVL
jgi:hypothetical protein